MTSSYLTLPHGLWALRFSLPDSAQNGPVLEFSGDQQVCLDIRLADSGLSVHLKTQWKQDTRRYGNHPFFDFELNAPGEHHEYELMWLDSVVRLYADGSLIDEEWPLGEPLLETGILTCADGVQASISPLSEVPDLPETQLETPAQFYMPPYHNASVGDCMPFVHNGHYRLYHLFDRRHHNSKKGLGAHQWAHISTDDLRTWTLHPIAIGIDEQWEGSICTGSMIEHEGCIYAFYAARMSDGSPARLTWATSEDGVHFRKSGEYFALTAPYEPVSARDPKVFRDAEGLFHMLVTTSMNDGRPNDGCLAHLTSPDLMNWTQLAPMLIPGYPDQPECSDYFEWNGRYYLVFSNHLAAHYRISDHPFGPWRRPQEDTLISPNLAVPKTACFDGRMLVSGWVADNGWGGSLITHELIQREDGSLGVKYIDSMMPELTEISLSAPLTADGSSGYTEQPVGSGSDFRLRAQLRMDPSACADLILDFDEARYTISFDPLEKRISVRFPGTSFLNVSGLYQLINADFMEDSFSIDLIVRGDILMLLLPGGRMLMPPRLKHSGACRISLGCRDGRAELSD